MIKEAKDILRDVVLGRVPDVTIARNMAEEQRAVMARQWPIVPLITNPGRFDGRESKTIRCPDEDAGVWKERYVRGRRILPMLLRRWAENEDAADALFSRIIPAIPRKWELDGFEGLVVINNEEHSDFEDNMNKLYLSVVEIEFSVPVALEEKDAPTVKAVEAEPELAKV